METEQNQWAWATNDPDGHCSACGETLSTPMIRARGSLRWMHLECAGPALGVPGSTAGNEPLRIA